jgi:PhnB protein
MAVETVPDGLSDNPDSCAQGDELYAFLKAVFEVELLDRHEAAAGGPAYMSIRIGDSIISIMQPIDGQQTRSALYVYIRDVDAVHRRAIEAGAQSIQEPTNAVHGDRIATVIDRFGNQWTIASRIEQISVEELHRRLAGSDQK